MTEQNRHLFGFLGTGKYKQCTYTSETFTSPRVTFAQTASALTICHESGEAPGELDVTIFATKEAEETHGEALATEFAAHGLIAPDFVTIPSHFDEASIIALFEALSDNLMTDNAVLSFDLTHGFRAQPAIALLVLDYIQAVNPTCRIEHLLYGAYQNDLDPVPLVDLIGLWQLRDWAAGFREFHRTGSVARLGELIDARHSAHMRATEDKSALPEAMRTLGKLLNAFEDMSSINALPKLFGEQGREGIIGQLAGTASRPWETLSLDLGRFARPITEELERELAPMRASDWSSVEGLRAQIAWITWLGKHDRYQQALTVAREWATSFVSLLLAARGLDVPREEADRIFNLLTNPVHLKDATAIDRAVVESLGAQVPDFATGCNKLVAKRNRLNHAWMPEPGNRDDAKPKKTDIDHIIADVTSVFSSALTRFEAEDTPNNP